MTESGASLTGLKGVVQSLKPPVKTGYFFNPLVNNIFSKRALKGQGVMSYRELGFTIHRHRRLAHLSQQQLADLAGISRNYVSIIENGRANNISAGVLGKLAEILKLETAYLIQILEQDEKGKI